MRVKEEQSKLMKKELLQEVEIARLERDAMKIEFQKYKKQKHECEIW